MCNSGRTCRGNSVGESAEFLAIDQLTRVSQISPKFFVQLIDCEDKSRCVYSVSKSRRRFSATHIWPWGYIIFIVCQALIVAGSRTLLFVYENPAFYILKGIISSEVFVSTKFVEDQDNLSWERESRRSSGILSLSLFGYVHFSIPKKGLTVAKNMDDTDILSDSVDKDYTPYIAAPLSTH